MASSNLNIKITAIDHASKALKSIQSGIIRLVGAVVALTAAFKAIAFPAQAAAEFEREMVNVAKTTNFTDSQIAGLSDTLLDLSKNMSTSATGLAAIAATAGQLGLGSFGVDAIATFTESVAKASVTLGLTTEKAAEFGAQITSIFNLDPSNIEQVFSTLNELSNTSVATAGQIADIVKRIGSVGGVTLQQSSALAAFFRDLGVQVEVAGTSTVKVLSNMSAKAADFAEVANVSTKRWLELMEQDTISALTLVTSKLYEMDRAQRDATAKELFGGGRILSTFTKLIDEAGNGYERLNGHLESARTSYQSGTSSLEEYEKVMDSLSEQTKVMFNSIRAVAIEMGENLTPSILRAVKAFTEFVNSDAGNDFFLQVSEGLKNVIDGLIDAGSYLASWGNTWVQILSAVVASFKVLVGISVLKWVLGIVNGFNNAGSAIAKYATWAKASATATNAMAKAQAASAKVAATSIVGHNGLTKAVASNTQAAQKAAIAQSQYVAAESLVIRALEQYKVATLSATTGSAELAASRNNLLIATTSLAAAQDKLTASTLRASIAQKAAASSSTVQGAVLSLGALGGAFKGASKGAGLFASAIGLVPAALTTLWRFISGPFGIIIASLVIFREEIANLLGVDLSPTIEIDIAQEARIDKRNAQEVFENAMRVISDIGQDVARKSEIELKVPLDTAIETDKVAFADQVNKDLKDAAKLVNATKVVSDAINKRTDAVVGDLAFDFKVNLSAKTGNVDALNVQAISADMKRATEELDTILAGQAGNMNEYIAGVSDYTDGLRANIQKLGVEYIQAVSTFEEGFDIDLAGSSLEELKDLRLQLLIEDSEGVRDVTLETIEAFDKLIENRKNLNRVLESQQAAELQVEKNAKAAADAIGLIAATTVNNLTVELRDLQLQLEQIQKKKNETQATDPIDSNLLIAEESLRLQIADKEKRVNEEINKTKADGARAVLKGLADQQSATALVTQETLSGLDATEKNSRTIEDINEGQVAHLSEMITKRSIINVQIQKFDEYSQGALDTAKSINGAWDNINKTIRSMEKSMADFGVTLDEILRKRAISEGQDAFDLGIDKDLETQLDKINKKYDELIEKAKEKDSSTADNLIGGRFAVATGGESSVEDLEKQREAAIEAAEAKADGLKLTEEQRLKEAEVTKALNDQKSAQKELNDLIASIKVTEEAGGFEGADGIEQYRKAMESLGDAQDQVNKASDITRASLKDIGRTEGFDPAKVKDYSASLKELDTAGIALTRSQASMANALATSTETLVKVERTKLSSIYQGLNNQINAITKNYPELTAEVNKATIEADKSASSYGKMAGSMQEVITRIQDMQKAGDPFAGLIESSAKFQGSIANIGKLFGGEATAANIDVGLVLKEGTAATLKSQVDAVLNPAGNVNNVEVGVVVTEFTDSQGGTSFVLKDVEIEPDADELKGTTKAVIEDQTYFFKADTPKVRKSLEESFKEAFNITVKANVLGGVQSNAAGGSIRGAGSGTSDSILSWLSNGEYVIKASSVAKFGTSFFDLLNAGALPRFASGGLSSGSPSAAAVASGSSDSIDLNFNAGGKTYTLHGERQQAKAIVDMFKNMDRG